MGLCPILYQVKDRDHSKLSDTLKEWANYARDGLQSKLRIICTEAKNSPLLPYNKDREENSRVVEILKQEKLRLASEFYKVKPPLEWLNRFRCRGIVVRTKNSR